MTPKSGHDASCERENKLALMRPGMLSWNSCPTTAPIGVADDTGLRSVLRFFPHGAAVGAHPEDGSRLALKKISVLLEDYQVHAVKKMARQKKVHQSQLLREALDLLIAHYHFSRIEPGYTRDVDEFLAKNRHLLKNLFR